MSTREIRPTEEQRDVIARVVNAVMAKAVPDDSVTAEVCYWQTSAWLLLREAAHAGFPLEQAAAAGALWLLEHPEHFGPALDRLKWLEAAPFRAMPTTEDEDAAEAFVQAALHRHSFPKTGDTAKTPAPDEAEEDLEEDLEEGDLEDAACKRRAIASVVRVLQWQDASYCEDFAAELNRRHGVRVDRSANAPRECATV